MRPRSHLHRTLVVALVLIAAATLLPTGFTSPSAHVKDEELPLHFFHASIDQAEEDSAINRERASTIDQPTYIPFDERQDTELKRAAAFRFAFTRLSPSNSRFILYPQSFSTADAQFDQGALISTMKDGFDSSFASIADDSDISLASAKALYDVSIAILTIEGEYNGMIRPLTYEAYDYCAPLYNYLNTKYAQCWRSADYWDYIATTPSHEATSVVYVDESDVKSGKLLLSDGFPRFGALVVPDIYAGADATISSFLGATGRDQLQAYLDQGGLIFSSGKGALLLQTLGLVASGTLNTGDTLVPKPGKLSAGVTGCGEAVSGADAQAEWAQRTLCFSPSSNGSSTVASLQSAPVVLDDSAFTVISRWNGTTLRIKNSAGAARDADPAGDYPHIMWAPVGKGQLVLHLGNPVLEEASFGWFFDALFLAMSQPIIIDTEIESGLTKIPVFEQLALSVNSDLKNLFDEPLGNVSYVIWVASGLNIEAPLPAGCSVVPNTQRTAPGAALNSSFYLDCSPASGQLAAFQTLAVQVKVFIEDVSITQRGTGIPLVYPQVNYTVASRDNVPVFVDWGPVSVDAYEAALIRCDMNADPLGFYPLSGSGIYVDNVLTAENKANTNADDVTFISYIPLISPLVDIGNQAAVATLATFDWQYYDQVINNVANYSYPFLSLDPRDFDYLDYALLLERAALLAADWDIPVKNNKTVRDASVFGPLPSASGNVSDIPNSGYASNAPTSTQFVTNQVFFSDANSFYGLGVPRMLAFLELSDPKAFAAYNVAGSWPSGTVPAAMLNPAGTALRKNIGFARSDVYYYKNREGLPLPEGLTYNSTFSLDQYESGDSCGAATASKLLPSHFGRDPGANPPAFPRGYRGGEWQNELLLNCEKRAGLVSLDELPTSSGPIRKVHYTVPFTDNSIASGDDVMGFIEDTSVTLQREWYYSPKATEGVARFGEYKDVRIVPVWYATFELNPNTTRKGGYFTFTLPSGTSWNAADDPVGNNYISYGADQVAITSTTYNPSSNVITTFFKRGNMPNEAYGKSSQMTVTLERLRGSLSGSPVAFALQELIYDLSIPAPHQSYQARTPTAPTVTFSRIMAFSLPALRLEYKLERVAASNESFVLPYESFEPFMRNGMYFQELRAHQTVWGSAEIHPDHGDPGLVTTNGAFSLLASLGISSIPFREYLTVGAGQLIPLAAETSRVEWTDIWDRPWAQPVRSTFVDAAPIPGPLRNFQMTTTYELLDPTTGVRSLQWQSDQELVVRAQVKVLNNYEKWFEHTDCEANQVMQLGKHFSSVVYGDTTVSNNVTDFSSTTQWINYGHKSGYGVCFQDGTVTLGGVSVSASQRQSIKDVQICSKSKPLDQCKNLTLGLPTLKARPSSVLSPTGSKWNYATQVANHWPSGYILEDMWDFTHTDYWDSQFGKGYPWHFDNPLPSADSGNSKPYNLIAFSIFKGVGYEVSYSSNLTHANFRGKMGWWSDQLQNKDDTLVAGQSKSLSVSVGAAEQIPAWIPLDQITTPGGLAAQVKSNIYVCEFNPQRAQIDPQNPRHAYLGNVVRNNIVPVDPTLSASDPRLSSYDCQSPGYSPTNISQFNNYLPTDTARDWLYFGANLRGGAKEDVNVLYSIKPMDGVHREGITSVVDGGRFTYWNPGLGPNAFADVDNPVSTVLATRTDLEVVNAIYPTSLSTFNATVIQRLDLSDPDEIERSWTSSIYYNSHGFGDAQVSVYVGGYKGTEAIVSPGATTFVRVTFANNAGFDWNLLASAIDFVSEGSAPISANDLLYRYKHAIQAPISYNFMDVQIPAEYKPYISIKPSNHNIDTAPLQFDFQAINVATIRDGFKGDYYYQLTVADNIPDSLRGKLVALNVTLKPSFFDRLPGPSDPTGIHTYQLSIPQIMFGVPLSSSSQWPDQVFWTSGFAHNLQFTHSINSAFKVQGVYSVNQSDVNELALVAAEQDNREAAIDTFWLSLKTKGHTAVPFTVSTVGSQSVVTYRLTAFGSQFPFPRKAGPDLAELHLLVRTVAPQLPYGWNAASFGATATFLDNVNKQKQAQATNTLYVRASGPWIDISYSGSIVTPEGIVIYNQQLYQSNSGIAKVNVTATNSGSDVAFNTDIVLLLPKKTSLVRDGLEYDATVTPDSTVVSGGSRVVISTGTTLAPGEFFTVGVTIRFEGAPARLSNKRATSSNRTVISNSGANLALTADEDAAKYSALEYNPYQIGLTVDSAYEATLSGSEQDGIAKLNVSYSGVVTPVEYVWYRRNTSEETALFSEFARTNNTVLANDIDGFYPVEYKVAIVYTASTGEQAITQTNIVQFDDGDDRPGWFWFLVIGLPLICTCLILTALVLLILAAVIRRRHNREHLHNYDAEASRGVDADGAAGAGAAADKAPRRSFFGLGPVIVPDADGHIPKGRWVVDMDYLMTGARRVVVKDGNPTSNKPPEDWVDPDNSADEMDDLSGGRSPVSGDKSDGQRKPGFFRRVFRCF